MPNLFDALNTDLSSQQAGEAYHSQVDPLVEATTEVNKANVVDTAQQTALDLAKQNAQKRVTLENQIAGIKQSISNLQNQLVEIDQEINNFNKPMSDEEIMRIGEQLNVPEVATNYINARSGRLNREFEAKKYDVAKDESKKTRKEDYESTMRNLTTEIYLLRDKKNKAAQVDKSGYDIDIEGKKNELKVLDDKYSDEFGTSFLDSIKAENTPAPAPTTTPTSTSTSTTTEVDNTGSIVPQGWNWGVTESSLTEEERTALRSDVDKTKQAIDYVSEKGKALYPKVKDNMIEKLISDRNAHKNVKRDLDSANKSEKSYQDSLQDKNEAEAKEKAEFKKLYDRRVAVLEDEDSSEDEKAKAKAWMREPKNSAKIKQYGLKQY